MKHVISLSGGIGSYFTLKRVLEKQDKKDLIVIFCDVKNEDKDLYRFLNDIEKKFNLKIKRLSDGRTPIELSKEEKFLYNSRVANCSKKLKSKIFNNYLKTIKDECILYFGIDFTEIHRCEAIRKNYKNYRCEFPLCNPPFLYKYEMLELLKQDRIEVPRMYRLGFNHNNCRGQCFKGGIGHFKNLLEKDRETFIEFEKQEQDLIKHIGKDVAILKRKGKPFTLKELRNMVENTPEQLTLFECQDIGGCGCFIE